MILSRLLNHWIQLRPTDTMKYLFELCASFIAKPLPILFRNCFANECFPKEWKKSNIVLGHKTNDKQLIKNYQPVSLLLVCRKIFEKIIFNSFFKCLDDNNFLNGNQLGFPPFLDLSKAFDKVSHDGLIYKLKRLGICGNTTG